MPYASLSNGLRDAGACASSNDMVLAVRLDNGQTLAFPFLDSDGGAKVGECSLEAFTALGGVPAADINMSDNSFVLLFFGDGWLRRQQPSLGSDKICFGRECG